MRKFNHTAKFSCSVKCVPSNDGVAGAIALASIESLKGIIPERVLNNYALLPIAFNSCVVNRGNKNGDMIDTATALTIYKYFNDSQLNTEHDRTQIVGHIVNAGLSSFDENFAIGAGSEILQEADVAGKTTPFNICLAAVIYRVLGSQLEDAIETASDPNSPNHLSISASWEIGFDDFVIAVGSRDLSDCQIISDADQINGYMRHVMAYGGSGKTPDGKYVFRLIAGDALPLGIGLTFSPAADVSGIVAIPPVDLDLDEPDADDAPASAMSNVDILEKLSKLPKEKILEALKMIDKNFAVSSKDLIDGLAASGQAAAEASARLLAFGEAAGILGQTTQAISSLAKTNVTSGETSILNNMKKFKTTKEALAAIETLAIKDESLAAVLPELRELIEQSILDINTEWTSKLTEANNAATTLSETKTQLETKQTELEKNLKAVSDELAGIKSERAAAEAQNMFDQRMTDLDEKFDLTDKQREIIAGEIKGLDEASYSSYIDKKVNFLVEKSAPVVVAPVVAPAVVVEPIVAAEAVAAVVQAVQPEVIPVPNSSEASKDEWMKNLAESFSQTKVTLVNRRK